MVGIEGPVFNDNIHYLRNETDKFVELITPSLRFRRGGQGLRAFSRLEQLWLRWPKPMPKDATIMEPGPLAQHIWKPAPEVQIDEMKSAKRKPDRLSQ